LRITKLRESVHVADAQATYDPGDPADDDEV
jgi:hypothetical protein